MSKSSKVISVKRIGILLFLMSLLVACFANADSQKNYLFVTEGGAGNGTGGSWADAISSADLPNRLNSAAENDVFYVAKGIYKPTANHDDREASFILNKGVKLFGGFVGNESGSHEQMLALRDVLANKTIFTGDIGGDDKDKVGGVTVSSDNIVGANSYHVVVSSGDCTTEDTVIDGFVITGGKADKEDDSYSGFYGGGMFNKEASPSVVNCTFSGNGALAGGGMFNLGSSPKVTDCSFSGNAAKVGGGICGNFGYNKVEVTNCSFLNNLAFESDGWGGSGGGAWADGYVFIKCVFKDNRARGNSYENGCGGGAWSSNSEFTDCTFLNNTAMDNPAYEPPVLRSPRTVAKVNVHCGYGGGLWTSGSTLLNCTFDANSAACYGGGLYVGEQRYSAKSNKAGNKEIPFMQAFAQSSGKKNAAARSVAVEPEEPEYYGEPNKVENAPSMRIPRGPAAEFMEKIYLS